MPQKRQKQTKPEVVDLTYIEYLQHDHSLKSVLKALRRYLCLTQSEDY